MARALLPILSTMVGLILLLQAGYPLYAFAVDSMNGGLTVSYSVEGGDLVVELRYDVRVPLKDAVLKVSASNGKEWSVGDESLEAGESLVLRIPLSELEGADSLRLSIEGSIAGLYPAGIALEVEGAQG